MPYAIIGYFYQYLVVQVKQADRGIAALLCRI
jgi:hypothetical protein